MPANCDPDEPVRTAGPAVPPGGLAWPLTSSQQVAHLVRALELDVIPRLASSHRMQFPAPPETGGDELASFVACLLDGGDAPALRMVHALRLRGQTVESLYLGLFTRAARHLGELWEQDRCDFATVTVALGRLQRLLRELSPAFGAEVQHPAGGRRALLTQAADEQHSFGLSMVAEFFRRSGWDIVGGPGYAARDAAAYVHGEWFDMVGFSLGSQVRLPWLRESIATVRQASRNKALIVLVGGPVFVLNPEWVSQVGADGSAREGGSAPQLAEDLIAAGVARP